MRRHRRGAFCFLALAGVGILTSSCGLRQLAFTQDSRVHISAPSELQEVSPPFLVRWTANVPPQERFALFVDRAPVRPGWTLRQFAEALCANTSDCPGASLASLKAWLAQQSVYETAATRLSLSSITLLGQSASANAQEVHQITIVLMGPDNRRDSESEWSVDVRIKRTSSILQSGN